MTETTEVSVAQSRITDEAFNALGLKRQAVLRRLLGWLFAKPTRKFASQLAETDQAVSVG